MSARKLLAIACAGAIAFSMTTITPAQNDTASIDAQVRDLMLQKRDILQQRLEMAKKSFLSGQITNDRVLSARNDVLDAELDLAASKADRIAVLESKVEILKEIEEAVSTRQGVNGGPFGARLEATIDRIDAEIALLREKAKP